MGTCHSDVERSQERSDSRPVHLQRQRSNSMGAANKDLEVESPQKYDQEAVDMLKSELEETPEIFVLNNMLMSVMFFENFQRRNAKLMHASSTKMERDLNRLLLRHGTKNCIAPDALYDEVNRNVCFRRRDKASGSPLQQQQQQQDSWTPSEQLVPRRLYVVSSDIEVFDSLDVPQYSEIDKPSYRAMLQDSERKGYVKLRLIEKIPRALPASSCTLDEPRPSCSTTPTTVDDQIYDYATIRELRTPKPVLGGPSTSSETPARTDDGPQRRDTLPEECFCTKRQRKDRNDLELDEDELARLDESSFYETASYIRSEGFMHHFQAGIFPGSLAGALGLKAEEVAAATAIPGAVFCRLREPGGTGVVDCEIVPSVAVSWPAKQAFDFERRSRPIITDRRRGIRYQWPTSQMIEEIVHMNQSVAIPTGYVTKRPRPTSTASAASTPTASDGELEWELCFPKAERYVETRMTHAQVRGLLFMAALHRALVEPETRRHGLLLEHVRRHLYWECETNYRDWPEHRLGAKLLAVLENLCAALARAQLPDFFVKHKNVFENTPKKYLGHAQKVFHEVQQAPVMYFIKALRHLKYRNEHKFYPMPDFMELYRILTTDGALYMNPALGQDNNVPTKYKGKKYGVDSEHMLTRIQIQNRKKRMGDQKKEDQNLNKRKDSINLQWVCEKKFDKLKSRSILCFFIKHFIEIGRESSKFKAVEQGLFYLKQAWYLTKILDDIECCKLDAYEFFELIAKQEEALMRDSTNVIDTPEPPVTPTRKSFQFSEASDQNAYSADPTNNLNTHMFVQKKVKKVPSSLKTRTVNRSVSFVEDDSVSKRGDNDATKRTLNVSKNHNNTSNSPTEKITFITSF